MLSPLFIFEHSPSQVQGPGTCCLAISVIHHLASTLSDQRWKRTSSQRTGTRSAVEASCVMHFTNRQSSSSSSSSSSFLFESQQPLFRPCITSSLYGINFLKNFANLLMMSLYHSHLIFISPVHHRHHHHHFYFASLRLCSTPDSKLTFSINPFHHCLHTFLGGSHGFSWQFPDLMAHRFSVLFFCFNLFCLIRVID